MKPLRLADPSDLPSEQLEDWGPVKEPRGTTVSSVRGWNLARVTEGTGHVGVWECTPGRWRRQVMSAEFMHCIAGRARFYPDHGPAIDIQPGDSVWFPANTSGTWEISETLRKTYVVVPTPTIRSFFGRMRREFTRLLSSFSVRLPKRSDAPKLYPAETSQTGSASS